MSRRPKSILDRWTEFRRDVVPSDAPPVQVEEMRRAFYMGAMVMFQEMTEYVTELSDEAAEKRLTQYDNEFKDYLARLVLSTPTRSKPTRTS